MRKRPRTRVMVEPLTPLPEVGATIGYARVSTAEQSLGLQVDALRKFGCERIHEETVSAASSKRPQLENALGLLRDGDRFVVWKMDRLARSLTDLLRRVDFINARGAQFVSLTEKIDTSSASGRLLFHVLGALAEFERDLIRERTIAGLKIARAKGKQIGAEPKLSPGQRKAMQEDRTRGMSLRQLGIKYNVAVGTVQKWSVGPSRKIKRKK